MLESVSSAVSPNSLASRISSTEPRYSFYRHAYNDGASSTANTAIVFIYTCPTSAKIKERMLYASSRQSTLNIAERGVGLTIAKKVCCICLNSTNCARLTQLPKLEASDPSDITAGTIEEEFAPKQEAKTSFSKPKRPGKR